MNHEAIFRDPATGIDPVSGYPETCAGATLGVTCMTAATSSDFNYTGLIPDTRDAGLVILDQPIVLAEYGQLAPAGTLRRLKARGAKNTLFTVSGYGLTYRAQAQSATGNISFRSRLMAQSVLTNLNSALNDGFNLQTQGNGDSLGGTCSGDSGGPVFLGGFAYRSDRQPVMDYLLGD